LDARSALRYGLETAAAVLFKAGNGPQKFAESDNRVFLHSLGQEPPFSDFPMSCRSSDLYIAVNTIFTYTGRHIVRCERPPPFSNFYLSRKIG
jgi:hypothetical protein